MPALRVALAQINPTVGDIPGNSQKIIEAAKQAAKSGVKLVVFPELALTGYPIEDLALSKDFLLASEQGLKNVATELASQGLGELTVILGFPGLADKPSSWAIGQNKAAVITAGELSNEYSKHHLPNYSVFDEYRVFVPGNSFLNFHLEGQSLSVLICEDIWQSGGPVSQISSHNTALTLVINGSPFESSKTDSRLDLVRDLAINQETSVAYVNLVGGQDDLVFDGNSFVVNGSGEEVLRGKQFEEDLVIFDFQDKFNIQPVSQNFPPQSDTEQVWQALVLGLRDYVEKNQFRSVLLGLSGGIDSSVCAALAVDALGSDRVFGVAMPSKFSSEHSIADAKELANRTNIHFKMEPIEPIVEEAMRQLELSGLAAENLQARVRALILMGLSNQHGHLVLTTGNKTELAVGYSTIYGDSAGGFAPIKDVEKTLVWELAKYRNQLALERGEKPPIPESSISKPPSAELRENQLDQDSLPDYKLLDQLLELHIEQRLSASELIERGFEPSVVRKVLSLVVNSEWKRRQGAIGPRITKLAFGRERRMPITYSASKENN